MKESFYRTARTYGAPTGYDHEISHLPDKVARLAEKILTENTFHVTNLSEGYAIDIVDFAFHLAKKYWAAVEAGGHLIEVQDAPDQKNGAYGPRGTP